ncbi:major facilitator superfamily transporter [Diplogelasinospora grovesii]|uniref:Major facilitator superfamily transporter n=1 Tax=Diplogelasinospora grovesii TaxID=303347 RepID=A0AAN6NDF8_9PEZI|nr:major facilitator superfamily transporter [Diplogelasinospora grovesii]
MVDTHEVDLEHGQAGHHHQHSLGRTVDEIDSIDALSGYLENARDNGIPTKNNNTSSESLEDDDDDGKVIVSWSENDPENPYNWSDRKKGAILWTTMFLIINSTMGSALPSNAIPFMTAEWGVTSQQQKVLPISVYLIGYVMGPIVWAPLSEQYGRKHFTICTFVVFTIFTMACALSPNWSAFLVFRLFCGIFASAPIAIVSGIFADIYDDPRTRGRSMGLFMVTTVFGPIFAPIISGFCAPTIGWRWAFWVGLIYAVLTLLPLVFFLPETYGPILLLRRARAIRDADPTSRAVAAHEMGKQGLKELATVVLTRPVRMILWEPIVSTTCAYLALCYAIFYMSFQAFPIIFQGVYGLSPGVCGLTYLAIGAGAVLSLPLFYAYDDYLVRAKRNGKKWAEQEEYRRLPLACVGGPLFVISLFWLGWSARQDVTFWVPLLAGIPFGMGFSCIFQALVNYLVDAYEIYAASANAAASCSRSLLATILPLATTPMFNRLGIAGACSLLAGLSMVMSIVPFIFIWKGEKIRANSKFCIHLKKKKEDMIRKKNEEEQRLHRRRERERLAGKAQGQSSDTEKGLESDGTILGSEIALEKILGADYEKGLESGNRADPKKGEASDSQISFKEERV